MKTITHALCLAALIAFAPVQTSAQQSPVGEWNGVLSTPIGPLTLIIRIRANPDGSYAGDLESVDQAAGRRTRLTTVSASGNNLSFTLAAIGASYVGEWKDADQAWSGVFEQGAPMLLVLKRGVPAALSTIEGLDGTWRAILQRDTTKLRLALHVRTTGRGTSASLDSPDVGALGISVAQFERTGDTISFSVPDAQVQFRGTLGDAHRLQGQWTRQGLPGTPLTFARDRSTSSRPVLTQEPVVAKGYRAEEVSFSNASDASVKLAGTLTIPDGRGPFPAVVLLSGSGPQNRDEAIFGHKPFAVLADHLSKNGIAVLRFDDRGVGTSTGKHAGATSAQFATDANAAFDFLAGRRDIKRDAIGFVGHSEGGMIGPIAAASNDRVAFLVLLAGPGTNTDQLMLSQRRLLAMSQGVTSEMLDKSEPIIRDILHAVRAAPDSLGAMVGIRAVLTTERLQSLGATEPYRDAIASGFTGTWMRYFLKYEPAPNLSRLRVPVLAINGSKDRQVPSTENLAAIRAALSNNRDATIRELPDLNHMFQTSETGALNEYERIAETFSVTAMDLITEWIRARFAR